MEPTNNPQPSVNPGATGATGVSPTPPVDAGMNVATNPVTPGGVNATPMTPGVNPVVTPQAPVVGVGGAAAAAGVAPVVGGAATTPVNPVVGVGAPDATATAAAAPVGAAGLDGLPMTEPIMRPDLPPAPDPVKQELEAPLKATAPVPGSIGSAVSVPEGGDAAVAGAPGADAQFAPNAGGSTPNVAFNDPATQAAPQQPGAPAPTAKKKMSFNLDLKNMNKGTLIALIVVAVMIVIGLAAVLIMQLV